MLNRFALLSASLATLLGAGSCRAGQQFFLTPSGSTTSGGLVEARVEFSTGPGTLTITLTNLLPGDLAGKYDAAQMISAVFFRVSDAPSSPLNVDSTDTGTLRDFSGSNSFHDSAGTLGRWTLKSKGSDLSLDVLGGGKPNQLIIGPQGGGYDANGSILSHDRSVAVGATFHFAVAGITADTTISDVAFRFGTTDGRNEVAGTFIAAVPEPTTFVSGGLAAMAGLGLAWRRRRAGRAA